MVGFFVGFLILFFLFILHLFVVFWYFFLFDLWLFLVAFSQYSEQPSLDVNCTAWKMQITDLKTAISTRVWGESRDFSPGFFLNPFLNFNYVPLKWRFCCLLNLLALIFVKYSDSWLKGRFCVSLVRQTLNMAFFQAREMSGSFIQTVTFVFCQTSTLYLEPSEY